MFQFLDCHQGMWVIKWNENDENVLKHSISIGSVVSNICNLINMPKFI